MTDTLTEARPFTLGDRVTYDDGTYTGTVRGIYSPNGDSERTSLFVVGSGSDDDYRLGIARDGGNRTFAPDAQDDEMGHWVSLAYGRPRHAEPVETPALSESSAEITTLEATISDLRSQVERLQSEREVTRGVITQIGEALKAEADRSEWCGEYDREALALVDSITYRYGLDDLFREAAVRDRTFEVCVHWTETVEHSTTVTVTASSESAAVDMVSDSPEAWVTPDDRYAVNKRSVEWDEIHVD